MEINTKNCTSVTKPLVLQVLTHKVILRQSNSMG